MLFLSWAASAVSVSVPSLETFSMIHFLRGLCCFGAVFILDGRGGIVETLILVSFMVEGGIYLRLPAALASSGILAAACIAFDATTVAARYGDVFAAIVPTGLLAAGAASLSCLAVSYREGRVRDSMVIEDLKGVATNLANSNRAFQDYAEGIESASREGERNRITRELHDTIGYALTNIIMMTRAIAVYVRSEPEKAIELVEKARVQADEALAESRKILYQLRSIASESNRGRTALVHLVRSFGEAMGIEVTMGFGDCRRSYGTKTDEAIFRLVQEGLTNAIWHGKATKVHVTLREEQGGVVVRIWDNGFGAADIVEGIGISGMRERFFSLGGSVVASGVADGFVLEARVPALAGEEEDE